MFIMIYGTIEPFFLYKKHLFPLDLMNSAESNYERNGQWDFITKNCWLHLNVAV